MSTRQIAIAVAAMWMISEIVLAGGIQLSSRGVRPTARGGAFVAGADGLGAFGFNPAGIAALADDEHDRVALVDFGFVRQSASYTRIDSGRNPQPKVSNQATGLPIPTIAVGLDLWDDAVLAVGVYVPYAGLGKYDETGPQRYSLVDLSSSLLAITEVTFGYKLGDRVRLGAGVQNMVFLLDSTVAFSACPGETVCAPEDPEFDAVGRVTQLSVINPSGVLGVQVDVLDRLRVGASVQLPFYISGSGELQTRLPSSGFFDGAEVVGKDAEVSFVLPASVRFGIEGDPLPRWKVELAGSIEFWSQHDEFDIQPKGVRIENAAGVGTYEVGSLNIPRNFENTFSLNLGVEGQPLADMPLTVLAGYSFETAAAPEEYMTVLTVDGTRHLIAVGGGYEVGSWQLGGTLGFVAVAGTEITPEVGRAPQLSPIRDNSEEPLEVFVNWGEYSSWWLIVGASASRPF